MIYGRNQIRDVDHMTYDYVGCFYPEGYLSPLANVFFNRKDINEVVFKGHCDIEEKLFVESLAMKKYRNRKEYKK